MVFAMKVGETKLSSNYLVTVPKAIREALGLKKGDIIEWHIEGDKVVVRKKPYLVKKEAEVETDEAKDHSAIIQEAIDTVASMGGGIAFVGKNGFDVVGVGKKEPRP
mgnify:CR=1 FL=1